MWNSSQFARDLAPGVKTGARIRRRRDSIRNDSIGLKSERATKQVEGESARLKTEYEAYAESGPRLSKHSCIPLGRASLVEELNDGADASLAEAFRSDSINAYWEAIDLAIAKGALSASTYECLVYYVTVVGINVFATFILLYVLHNRMFERYRFFIWRLICIEEVNISKKRNSGHIHRRSATRAAQGETDT